MRAAGNNDCRVRGSGGAVKKIRIFTSVFTFRLSWPLSIHGRPSEFSNCSGSHFNKSSVGILALAPALCASIKVNQTDFLILIVSLQDLCASSEGEDVRHRTDIYDECIYLRCSNLPEYFLTSRLRRVNRCLTQTRRRPFIIRLNVSLFFSRCFWINFEVIYNKIRSPIASLKFSRLDNPAPGGGVSPNGCFIYRFHEYYFEINH